MQIIFVIGPSCVGKSTYIKEHYKNFEIIDLYKFQQDYKILGLAQVVESYEKCKEALIKTVKENKNVVMEHTLLRAERRIPYIEAVKALGNFDIECVCIKPNIELLVKRKILRGLDQYGLSEEEIKQMCEEELKMLELPTVDEGFSKITIIEK